MKDKYNQDKGFFVKAGWYAEEDSKMKDKEKQIEELSKDIDSWDDCYDENGDINLDYTLQEHLYILGYRKLPEDCVVLSEEEYEYLKNESADIAKDYQEMGKFYYEKCEECDLLKQQLDEMWTFKTTQDGKCNILDIVRRVERKETAEKILSAVYERLILPPIWAEMKTKWRIDSKGSKDLKKELDELAKQFGVEVEE